MIIVIRRLVNEILYIPKTATKTTKYFIFLFIFGLNDRTGINPKDAKFITGLLLGRNTQK